MSTESEPVAPESAEPGTEPPPPPKLPALRLSALKIENYKAIDHLELEFPLPELPGEPDVFVLGSANGVGKTSVLEACALLGMMLSGIPHHSLTDMSLIPREPFAGMVRRGTHGGSISGRRTFEVAAIAEDQFPHVVRLGMSGLTEHIRYHDGGLAPFGWRKERFPDDHSWSLLGRILAEEPEPAIMPGFLYFHAYRRVRSGRVSMGELTGSKVGSPVSLFKQAALTALMSRSGLFEDGQAGAEEEVERLNGLLETYARGRLGKLARDAEGHIDLRIEPLGGGPSLSFDGLSSGQKEVISTFFLIWYHTRNQPALVLVDEPELHLNAEWQRPWVSTLARLAPWNQYILATHSEEIFASVRPERRLILRAD